MNKKFSGKFIVLDGPDGCGKSTQAELLIKWIKEQGISTVGFRDPGDTAIGEKIREILLNPEHYAMSSATELLLYMAARAQLWSEAISPALDNSQCVIMDRWLSSTLAYQGWAGGVGMDRVMRIASESIERVWPDITLILDVNRRVASERLDRLLDRMEAKGEQYHTKVRKGFLKLAEENSDCFVVDAAGSIEDVHKKIIRIITEVSF